MGQTVRTPSRREGSSVGTLELPQAHPHDERKAPVTREYVGIDLHRRRSVIIRKDSDGQLLSKVHIDNNPIALAAAVSAAGPTPRSFSKRRSAGTGRRMSSPRWALGSIWPIRWGTTGGTGGSRTMSGTRPT